MDDRNTPLEEKYLGLTPSQFNLAFFAVVGTIGLGIAIYFGAFGALLGSSGGDGSSSGTAVVETSTPTSTGEARPAPTVTAEEAANSAVLKLADMPSGWAKDAPDDDDDEGDFEFSEECAMLNVETFPGELASAESADFEGPAGQSASSDSSVFTSAEVAKATLQEFNDTLSRCQGEFVQAFKTALLEGAGLSEEDALAAGLRLSFQDGPPLPQLGDLMTVNRLGIDMTVEGIDLHMIIDFVTIAEGRLVGGLYYFSVGEVNSLEEEVLAEIIANKLAEASASLAE